MKNKTYRFDNGKLKTTPTDLSQLNNLLKKKVIKKTKYDDLVKKFHAIDTDKLVNKTNYNAKNKDIEDEIPGITKLPTNVDLNAKINVLKIKNPILQTYLLLMLSLQLKRKHLTLVI